MMISLVVAAMVMTVLPNTVFAATCSYAQFGADHTMCIYSPRPCASNNPDCRKGGLTNNDIALILKTHNDFRSKVASGNQSPQPKGSNIREIKWNSELATVAQRWADQNNFGHDKNRLIAGYKFVGQNAAYTSNSLKGSTFDIKGSIEAWYNEVKGFSPSNVNNFQFQSSTGHYSQMLWAETDRIGCGYSYYKEGSMYKKLYICNYAIGGNVQGQKMYQQGAPATACGKGKSGAYPALCAS